MRRILFAVVFASTSASGVAWSQVPLAPVVRPALPVAPVPPMDPRKQLAILTTPPRQAAADDDELQKLLIARHNAAVEEMRSRLVAYDAGITSFESVIDAARRLSDSELELSDQPADHVATLERFLELAQFIETAVKARAAAGQFGGEPGKLHAATFLRLDAEVRLLKAKRKAAAKK